MKYLAVDYGARRLGLALSDDAGTLAFPHGTHTRRVNDLRGDVDYLVNLLKAHQVGAVVFGKPSGSEGSDATAAAAEKLAHKLAESSAEAGHPLTVVWCDERYSTAEVLKGLAQAGISQREARQADGARATDARAAAVILQSYLDSLRAGRTLSDTAPSDGSQ